MTMLGIMDLRSDMILSTLSISYGGFSLGFPKRPHTNGDVGLIRMNMYSLIIHLRLFPKLANVGLPPNNPSHYLDIKKIEFKLCR